LNNWTCCRRRPDARLESDGFQVRDLPAGDIDLTIEFDMKSGRVIGRQGALHDLTNVDAALARDLHAAVAKVFEKGPTDLAAAGDQIGAAEAVKAGRQGKGFFGVLTPGLLSALQKIRVTDLDADTRKLVRGRMAVALCLQTLPIRASAISKIQPSEPMPSRS
jgi:hypothetical protein